MPCGVRLERGQREAVGPRAEAVAVRAGAQHQVEQALGAAARRQRGEDLVRRRGRAIGECGRADRLLDALRGDEVVERVDVGVGALAR